MKNLILTALICFFSLVCLSQKFDWAKQSFSKKYTNVTSICTDQEGNVYMVGYYTDSTAFSDKVILSPTNEFGHYFFLTKYNNKGEVIWVKTNMTETCCVRPKDLEVDRDGNIIIIGEFSNQIIIDDVSLASKDNYDAFIIKFNPEGKAILGKAFGGPASDSFNNLSIGQNNSYVIAGVVSDQIDFSPTNFIKASSNIQTEFIGLFTSEIDIINSYSISAMCSRPSQDVSGCVFQMSGISSELDGNILVVGTVHGSIEIKNNSFSHQLTSNPNSSDLFVIKLTKDGQLGWSKLYSSVELTSKPIVKHDNNGNCFIAGSYKESLKMSEITLTASGFENSFLIKLTSYGNVMWAKSLNGINSINALDIKDNFCYITGSYKQNITYEGLNVSVNLNSSNSDVFCFKVTSEGEPVWGTSSIAKGAGEITPVDIKATSTGCYISGIVSSEVNFDGNEIKGNAFNETFITKITEEISAEITSSIASIDSKSTLNIYPNPSAGIIKFDSKKESNSTLQIRVKNLLGDIVFKKIITSRETLDISSLPKGVYIIDVLQNHQKTTKKIIIQ